MQSVVAQLPKHIEQRSALLLSIAPNPVSAGEKVVLSYQLKQVGAPIFLLQDATGRVLFQKALENTPAGKLATYTLELTDVAAGMYTGTLRNDPEKATVKIAVK